MPTTCPPADRCAQLTMNSISWFEALQASLYSCFPCFTSITTSSNSDDPNSDRAPQYLRALLSNDSNHNGSSTSLDETLSLHSDIGESRTRYKPKSKRTISFFGFNLFGKRPPPIHLPDDDEEDVFLLPHRSLRTPHSSSSSYTFDSDAAPLDSAAITRFTAQDLAAQVLAQQEAERLAKEERRRKRRERKELKQLAAFVVGNDGEGDFEGFQGSGARPTPYKAIPSPLLRSAHDARDDDEEEADLDGITYARSSNSVNGGSHSGGRSNSDSRTSSSGPLPVRAGETAYLVPKSRSRSTKHSSSSKTHSSASVASVGSTQSPTSIGSPVVADPLPLRAKPNDVDPRFEGVDFDNLPRIYYHDDERFPSVGLGTRGQ